MSAKQRVLFLCTGNSARSQMAEAFLRHFGGENFESYSAGLQPQGINPLTIQVMLEIGYDLAGQHSKSVNEFLGKVFIHRLITVCKQADKNCPTIWPGVIQKEHWSLEDPAAFVKAAMRQNWPSSVRSATRLKKKVRSWVDRTGTGSRLNLPD